MDENGLRALLRELAEDELPPVRVSVDLAARKGRRKLRWRRIYLPGAAPIAAAAAVAVIVGFLTATGTGLHRGQSGPVAPVGLPAVPEQFSALVPYAAFGWLPKGYSPDGLASQTLLSTSQLQLTAAAAGGRLYTISFNAARVCRLTGPYVLKLRTTVTFPHGLECSGGLRFPLIGKAFDVKGAPAYWVNEHSSLVWEYGHNA
jgi:hypothetical protein